MTEQEQLEQERQEDVAIMARVAEIDAQLASYGGQYNPASADLKQESKRIQAPMIARQGALADKQQRELIEKKSKARQKALEEEAAAKVLADAAAKAAAQEAADAATEERRLRILANQEADEKRRAAKEAQRVADAEARRRETDAMQAKREGEKQQKRRASRRSLMKGIASDSGVEGRKFALRVPGVGKILIEFLPDADVEDSE